MWVGERVLGFDTRVSGSGTTGYDMTELLI